VPSEKNFQYSEGTVASVLRPVMATWDQLDGTINPSRDDEKQRYRYGPIWSDSSCAVDCAIFVGLMLDVGRIQIDQVSPQDLLKEPVPSFLMRKIVSRHWGQLDDTARSKMRDYLRDELCRFDPASFHPPPKGNPVADVINTCFHGVPQVSYTSVRVTRHCDGVYMVNNATVPRRNNCVYIGQVPVGAYVQARFSPTTDQVSGRAKDVLCAHDEGICLHSVTTQLMILDRMPPHLVVHVAGVVDSPSTRSADPYQGITITYLDRRHQPRSISYRAVGAVLAEDTALATHFLVVWHLEDEHVLYDGMKNNGRIRRIQGWWDLGIASCRIVTIFFQVESAVGTRRQG